ncbi:MAG: hypothetical protein ABSF56_03675 [Minisyncoccia bacterium]
MIFIITLSCLILALLLVVWVTFFGRGGRGMRRRLYSLTRHADNPLISPSTQREWESQGTFNPGAVKDDEGRVHLFYRAIGRDGLSRIGHAVSRDGRGIESRSPYPVYEPVKGYGMPEPDMAKGPHRYDLSAYASGGGWGGAEDPRTVAIDDRVYMTYTAFEGWESVRIAVTSISMEDMKKGRWRWRRPVLISPPPPQPRAKNWVLFPERINGKYAILHGIAPKILIAYVDSPEMPPRIDSLPEHGGGGYRDRSREGRWDNWVRGAGAPPIKTDKGWLLLYHALDKRDSRHVIGYKVGAMILDLKDPTKVLYRSPEPILSPDMSYENDGKPGVVYASGAVVKDGKLLVYYGGGDKHTCVAETPLKSLLDWMVKYGKR